MRSHTRDCVPGRPPPCRSLRLAYILDAVVTVTLTARILQKQRDRLLFLFGVRGAVVPVIFGSLFHSTGDNI